MAFRNSGSGGGGSGGGAGTIGTPTKSVEIGDLFEQGVTGTYSDAGHQHAFPGPAVGSAQPVSATGSDSDSTDTAPARSRHSHAHTRAMHLAGGHADLTADFLTFLAGDSRYASLIHGARHAPGGPDDLSGVYIPVAAIDAKGDLLVGAAADQLVRVPAGAFGTFLQSDPAQPSGMKWGTLPGVQAYDPSSYAIRKATTPDGIDLSYAGGSGVATPGPTNISITPFRVYAGGFLYTFSGTTLLGYLTRPVGVRVDSIVLRIDNAAGGPGAATIAFKQGSGSPPAMQQDDLSASSTAVYEVELYRVNVPASGAGTALDVRPVARGVDNQAGAMVKLAAVDLASAAASITLADIPQTLSHLDMRIIAKGSQASPFVSIRARFNQDAGSTDYDNQALYSDGTSVTGGRGVNEAFAFVSNMPAGTAPESGNWGSVQSDLLDYTNITKRKAIRSVGNYDAGDAPVTVDAISTYYQPKAVARIDLLPSAGSFIAGTRVALYGIR